MRIPSGKDQTLRKAAAKSGKTKTAYILEVDDEKLGFVKNRKKVVGALAGWLSHEEAQELTKAVGCLNREDKDDRDQSS